jgi:hypothetical protein
MKQTAKRKSLGITGCQPVVFGSVPKSAQDQYFTNCVVAIQSVAGKLPATAGWQPALPGILNSRFVIRASAFFRHSSFVIRHLPHAC